MGNVTEGLFIQCTNFTDAKSQDVSTYHTILCKHLSLHAGTPSWNWVKWQKADPCSPQWVQRADTPPEISPTSWTHSNCKNQMRVDTNRALCTPRGVERAKKQRLKMLCSSAHRGGGSAVRGGVHAEFSFIIVLALLRCLQALHTLNREWFFLIIFVQVSLTACLPACTPAPRRTEG